MVARTADESVEETANAEVNEKEAIAENIDGSLDDASNLLDVRNARGGVNPTPKQELKYLITSSTFTIHEEGESRKHSRRVRNWELNLFLELDICVCT